LFQEGGGKRNRANPKRKTATSTRDIDNHKNRFNRLNCVAVTHKEYYHRVQKYIALDQSNQKRKNISK